MWSFEACCDLSYFNLKNGYWAAAHTWEVQSFVSPKKLPKPLEMFSQREIVKYKILGLFLVFSEGVMATLNCIHLEIMGIFKQFQAHNLPETTTMQHKHQELTIWSFLVEGCKHNRFNRKSD